MKKITTCRRFGNEKYFAYDILLYSYVHFFVVHHIYIPLIVITYLMPSFLFIENFYYTKENKFYPLLIVINLEEESLKLR